MKGNKEGKIILVTSFTWQYHLGSGSTSLLDKGTTVYFCSCIDMCVNFHSEIYWKFIIYLIIVPSIIQFNDPHQRKTIYNSANDQPRVLITLIVQYWQHNCNLCICFTDYLHLSEQSVLLYLHVLLNLRMPGKNG